jgi:transposase
MIQVTPHMKILACQSIVDFRKGIDGLARLCRDELQSDPFSGAIFIFRNRRKTALKVLVYDGQGFWLCQKRLSTGRFKWWPSISGSGNRLIQVHELHILLAAGDPNGISVPNDWRKVESIL